MVRYMQINDDGYIVSDSYLNDTVDHPNMILVDMEFDPTNKRWNGTEWETYEPEETDPDENIILTDEQTAIFDTQLNVEYLVCLAELGL